MSTSKVLQVLKQVQSYIFRSSSLSCWRPLSLDGSSIGGHSNHRSISFLCTSSRESLMATSGSQAVCGYTCMDKALPSRGNVLYLTNPSLVFFYDKRLRYSVKAGLSSSPEAPFSVFLRYGHFMYGLKWRSSVPKLIVGSCSRNYVRFSTIHGVAHDITSSASSFVDKPGDHWGKGTLTLRSASCYLPHPDKAETGGEDAHFICPKEHVVGIADGVGGWADFGVDAGEYARRLMSNAVLSIKEERIGPINPTKVLEMAHSLTDVRGSSTACIIALSNEVIYAINLGDSGFIVIRDGNTVFRSPVQQHDFNHPYQLERGNQGDLPSSGKVFRVPVVAEDVIVAGTDGLFDNLCSNKISSSVLHGLRTQWEPQKVAQHLAALARKTAMDRRAQTPFSIAARRAGVRHYGGKLDDITVVVSYITTRSNLRQGARAKLREHGRLK